MPIASTAVECFLDGLAGSELGRLGRADRDRLAGLGIAALALAALGNAEGAETGDADLVALRQRLGDRADQRLHCLASVSLGQAGTFRHGRSQLCLVHECNSSLNTLLKRVPNFVCVIKQA